MGWSRVAAVHRFFTVLFAVVGAVGSVYVAAAALLDGKLWTLQEKLLVVELAVAGMAFLAGAAFLGHVLWDVLMQNPPAGVSHDVALVIRGFATEVLGSREPRTWSRIDTAAGIGAKVWHLRFGRRCFTALGRKAWTLSKEIGKQVEVDPNAFIKLSGKCWQLSKQVAMMEELIGDSFNFLCKLTDAEITVKDQLVDARSVIDGVGTELKKLGEQDFVHNSMDRRQLRERMGEYMELIASAKRTLDSICSEVAGETEKCSGMFYALRSPWLSGSD